MNPQSIVDIDRVTDHLTRGVNVQQAERDAAYVINYVGVRNVWEGGKSLGDALEESLSAMMRAYVCYSARFPDRPEGFHPSFANARVTHFETSSLSLREALNAHARATRTAFQSACAVWAASGTDNISSDTHDAIIAAIYRAWEAYCA